MAYSRRKLWGQEEHMLVGWLPDIEIQCSEALQKALMFRNLDIQRIRQNSRYITSKIEKHRRRGGRRRTWPVLAFQPSKLLGLGLVRIA